MADSQSKIDAAAEKAFAEAAEKKTAEAVTTKPAAAPVVAAAPVAAKPAAPVAVKAAAAKVANKKPAAKKAAKPVAKKIAKKIAKPAAKAKPVAARKAALPAPVKKAATVKAAAPSRIAKLKDTIMATANTDYTAKAKELAADAQTRAKAAFDKGSEYAAEATEFTKGNLEAVVASGKILAAGLQDMGRTYVEDVKGAVETVTADVKKAAAVKSPSELFQLQGEIARRNFDAMVATTSKNTEAMIKLANEAFAPLSSRMSLAVERIKKAA